MRIVRNEEMLIPGFSFSAVAAGVKHAGEARLDFGLVATEAPASAAGVTTTNLVYAAPVAITRNRLRGGRCSAVLINSGNANAYTGAQGIQAAEDLTAAVARDLGIDPELVIPMSTGVIGNPLPVERMMRSISELVKGMDPRRLMDVAAAMMTTDTRPKTVHLNGECSASRIKMVGMAKGAGMIAPNMATLLAVIMTDIRADAAFLKEALVRAVAESFNRITVDGDMSTNDTVLVMAGGRSDAPQLAEIDPHGEVFLKLLHEACLDLAKQLLKDGEGATKMVAVRVSGAPDNEAAARVARSIAESLLVKTAFHGQDPNWGRILSSAGSAGISFDPEAVDLFIGHVPIVAKGSMVTGDWESAAHEVMKAPEFSVLLDLGAGSGEAEILTTDLSREYVSINADYRS